MKNTNKLVALILAVLMLVGSTVAYASDTVSDLVSPNISIPAMEEQPESEATPAPQAGDEIAPAEVTVEEQPVAAATPAPEAGGETDPANVTVEEQPVAEATPAPEAGEETDPANVTVDEQPVAEATPALEGTAPAEVTVNEQPVAEATPTPEQTAPAVVVVEEQPVATPAPEIGETPTPTVTTESGAIDIRAAASADAEIIGQLSGNDHVVVLSVEGDWTKIRANGVEGYVFSKQLQVTASGATPVPVETVAPEESVPFASQYQRNELGELILDEQGNPISLTPIEGAQYLRDAEGNLILDEIGEPILIEVQSSAPEAVRSDLSQAVIKTWMDANEDTKYGDTVSILYEIQNFYGWTYTVQWQRKGADGWADVPGATGETHSFTLTEDNLNTEWRVRVDVAVPEASEGAAA